MAFEPNIALVAAVLSDEVYHNYAMAAPPGWVQIPTPPNATYDPSTGYYGEVWAQERLDQNGNFLPAFNADGSINYNNIRTFMLVNRGTTVTSALNGYMTDTIGAPGTSKNLGASASADKKNTVGADISIVFSQSAVSPYASAGIALLQYVEGAQPGELNAAALNIPVIVTGQSLGGYAADEEAVKGYTLGYTNIFGDTFNALPFTAAMANTILPQSESLPASQGSGETAFFDGIENYYVGNEILTSNDFVGVPTGNKIYLPNLPVWPPIAYLFDLHSTQAAIAQTLAYLYPSPNSPGYASAVSWLQAIYANVPSSFIPDLAAVIGRTPPPLVDPGENLLIKNADGTYSTLFGFSAQTTAAEQTYTYDPNATLLYSSQRNADGSTTITLNNAAQSTITFDAGTFSSTFLYSLPVNSLSFTLLAGGIAIGTLDLKLSGGGTFTLTNGTSFTVPARTGAHLTTPSSSASALDALANYLTELGVPETAAQLDQLNYHDLYPAGSPYTVTGTTLKVNNDAADVTYLLGTTPGAAVNGQSTAVITNIVNGVPTPTAVPATNILILDPSTFDLSQDTISNIQTLETEGSSVVLSQSQLDSFSLVTGGGTLIDPLGGIFNLAEAPLDPASTFNATATDWLGTTLIGNSQNRQVLKASIIGNDTLEAGNGTGDTLIAGDGVDALVGGTGGDTFIALDGLAAGSAITGTGLLNVLEADGDITGSSISGVQTLEVAGTVTLTGSQFNGFSDIVGRGTLVITTPGTYSLAGKSTVTINMVAGSSNGTTLIGNDAGYETLTASAYGNDVLKAGNGLGDLLVAGGGQDTLIAGSGGGELVAGTGVDTLIGSPVGPGNAFAAPDGLAPGSVVNGGPNTWDVVIATGDISGAIFTNWFKVGLVGSDVTVTAEEWNNIFSIKSPIDNPQPEVLQGSIFAATGGIYTIGNSSATALSSDGTTFVDNDAVPGAVLTASRSGNDTLIVNNGTAALLTAQFSSGNDILNAGGITSSGYTNPGSSGGDVLNVQYSTGNDTLIAAKGLGDVLDARFSTGSDILDASNGKNDILYGGYGNDILRGSTDNDVFYTGTGDEHIQGNGGSDTYNIDTSGLDSVDTINAFHTDGLASTLHFENATSASIVASQAGHDLVLTAGTDRVIVQNYFISAQYQVAEFVFSDGVTLTPQQLAVPPPALATLASVPGGLDRGPFGNLFVDANGDLFGTTDFGGAGGYGTVFEIVNTSTGYAGTPTTLINFNRTNGADPYTGLIADAAGDFFGTTGSGANNDGTVFEIPKTASGYGSTPITLASFNGTNGGGPELSSGLVTDVAGNLFGTTTYGGANGDGVVFEILKTGSSYASTPIALVSFNGADGLAPSNGLVMDAAGDLFGTTYVGGTNNRGTAFEVANTSTGYAGTPITLASFWADGQYPLSNLIIDQQGDLFGTASSGSQYGGNVFEIVNTSTGYATTLTVLASFNFASTNPLIGPNGYDPIGGLIADVAGDLFGTTYYGGVYDDGVIFEIAHTSTGYASTPTVLFSFNGLNGAHPYAGLSADAKGNLFGTTSSGGANGGTVFELYNTGFFVTSVASQLQGATISIQGTTITASVEAADIDPLFATSGANTVVIQGPGIGVVGGADYVSNLQIASGGSISLQGGTISTDPISVDTGGNISGYGTISGAETVNGNIIAEGGKLDITGNVDGKGILAIATDGSLQLDGTIAATESVTFAAGGGSLILGRNANVLAPVRAFGPGNAIALAGQKVTSVSYNASDDVLAVTGGTATLNVRLSGAYQQSDFSVTNGEVTWATVAPPPTPTISAGTPAIIEKGQTTIIGTVTPGLVGDTLAIVETEGTGSLVLGSVQAGGLQQIIYTAPDSIPASGTATFKYAVLENGAGETVATGAVRLDPGPNISSHVPAVIEKTQITIIGAITPGVAGDSFTLTQATGSLGSLSLGVVQPDGTQQVMYTAPANIPVSIIDGVNYTVTDEHADAVASGSANVQLDAGPSITSQAPAVVEKGQTTIVGIVAPGLPGDALTLKQTGGSGTVALQLVSGVEEVIYTAPASVPASTTDAVTYTITDQHNDAVATGNAAVQLKATGASITAVTPTTVEKGQTTEIGTVTPSTAGDTLTLKQTGGSGTVALQLVSGVEEVIYTAPASVPTSTTDAVSYTVTENGVAATGNASIQLDAGPTVTLLPFVPGSVNKAVKVATATPGLSGDTLSLVITQAPQSGTVTLQGSTVQFTQTSATYLKPVTVSFEVKDQLGDVTSVNTVIIASGLTNNITGGNLGNTDIALSNGILNKVILSGNGNVVDVKDGITSVSGGVNNNTVILGDGLDSVALTGSHNVVTLGDGLDLVTLDGGGNVVTLGNGADSVSVGGSGNQITLGNGIDVVHGGTGDTINLKNTNLTLYGTNEMVFMGSGNATVNDFSVGLNLKIGPTAGKDVLAHFASDPSGVVDLIGGIGGFKTAAAVVSALKSDGHGGTLLSFGTSGSLDFTGIAPSHLHAANFRIG